MENQGEDFLSGILFDGQHDHVSGLDNKHLSSLILCSSTQLLIGCGPFFNLASSNGKLLEMVIFFTCQIFYQVAKTQNMANKF
jgi:hypothetical protein